MNKRRQIKEHIRDSLKGETRAGDQIFIGLSTPVDEVSLPIILVYTPNESISLYEEAPKSYLKNLTLNLELIDKGSTDSDLDLNLEDMIDKVRMILEADETLGCLVDSIQLTGVELQSEDGGASPNGAALIQYSVQYIEDAILITDQNCLDDFQGVDLSYKIRDQQEPSEGVDDAKDIIDFET